MADAKFTTRIKPSGEYAMRPSTIHPSSMEAAGVPMRNGRPLTGPHQAIPPSMEAALAAHTPSGVPAYVTPTHSTPISTSHPNMPPPMIAQQQHVNDASVSMVARAVRSWGDYAGLIKIVVLVAVGLVASGVSLMGQIAELKQKPTSEEMRTIMQQELQTVTSELKVQRELLKKHEGQMNALSRVNIVIRYLVAHAHYVEDVLRAQAAHEKPPKKPEALITLESQVMIE